MLRTAFALLGLAAIGIGVMIFLLGPSLTADAFAGALHAIAQTPARVDGLDGANIDSEMRFYAVLWIAYGFLALWVARALEARLAWLRIMLFVFFVGGVGRALSLFVLEAPHPLFSVLMWIELLLPPALVGLSYARSKARTAP